MEIAKEPQLLFFKNLTSLGGISHFVTTRNGGVSSGITYSLNMGFVESDSHHNVIENRKSVALALGIPAESLVFCHQTHSTNIRILTGEEKGLGLIPGKEAFINVDALICDIPGICPVAKGADCVPVLLCDPVRKVVATIHAGWRGTVAHICHKTVMKMIREKGSSPSDILAGIGPSNGPCCYEVGEDVATEVRKAFGDNDLLLRNKGMGKYFFNMWEANRLSLLEAGLNPNNIEIMGRCTSCEPDFFFSSRRDGKLTGRLAAGIMIKI
jgi:YfiH family protein